MGSAWQDALAHLHWLPIACTQSWLPLQALPLARSPPADQSLGIVLLYLLHTVASNSFKQLSPSCQAKWLASVLAAVLQCSTRARDNTRQLPIGRAPELVQLGCILCSYLALQRDAAVPTSLERFITPSRRPTLPLRRTQLSPRLSTHPYAFRPKRVMDLPPCIETAGPAGQPGGVEAADTSVPASAMMISSIGGHGSISCLPVLQGPARAAGASGDSNADVAACRSMTPVNGGGHAPVQLRYHIADGMQQETGLFSRLIKALCFKSLW